MRFLLYLAIAYIIWRIVRGLMRPARPRPDLDRGPDQRERVEPRRGADIDYTRVRDADYRDLGDRERERDDR